MATVRKAPDAQSGSITITLATARVHGGRTRTFAEGVPGGNESRAVLAGVGSSDCFPTEPRRRAAGLQTTCKKSLADTSEGRQSVIVAGPSNRLVFSTCLFWERGGSRSLGDCALAEARVSASIGRRRSNRGGGHLFRLLWITLCLVFGTAGAVGR